MSKAPASDTTPSAAVRVKVASRAEKFVSSTASSTVSPGGTSKRKDTRSSASSCCAGVRDHTVVGADSSVAAAGGGAKTALTARTISNTKTRQAVAALWRVRREAWQFMVRVFRWRSDRSEERRVGER